MNIAMHMKEEVSVKINNLYNDRGNTQTLDIKCDSTQIDLFFMDIDHLKEFASNLNKAIKEVEK